MINYFCSYFRLRFQWSLFLILFFVSISLFSQNTATREIDRNEVGWYVVNAGLRFSQHWGLHAEYQWRRVGFGESWQQSLLRTGLNYHLGKEALFRLGYGNIETFPYSEYPIHPMGKRFTEHRIFQMFQLSQPLGKTNFVHRYMLEQRWIGAYTSSSLNREDEWNYLNRLRYMVRFQFPLYRTREKKEKIYGLLYDEMMIGFGKNVRENVFDQNRIGVQLGFVFNSKAKLEAGYFSQILQLGREVGGKNVFQFNSGFLLNYIHVLDLRKEKE